MLGDGQLLAMQSGQRSKPWPFQRATHMNHELDTSIGRDDLAPTQRLMAIASLLARGIERHRDDVRRRGDLSHDPERSEDGLELSQPACPHEGRG